MSDNVLRVIPLGGLGEVGKNMTVFEIADQLLVVDAGLAFPRDEHLGVDLILPDFGYLHDRDVLGGRPDARARGPRRRAPVPDARGADPRDLGDAPDARARQVEARRARPAARRPSCARSSPRARRSTSARSGSSSSACRTRSRTRSGSRSRPRPASCSTPATGSSTTRPVDGLRTDVGKLAELGNRGVDLLCGDSTNAERPGLHAVRARRRRGVPPDHPGPPGPRPDLELRLEHPPDAAGDRRRRRDRPARRGRRPLDAPQPERRAQPRLHRDARGVPRQARRISTSCRRTASWCSAPARRASRCRRSPASPTTTTRRSRSSAATR